MIEKPAAENQREFAHPPSLQVIADIARMLDRDVRVIDQRLTISDHRVTGDTQRQGAVIHPVRVLRKAIALDAPVVESINAAPRIEHTDVMHPSQPNWPTVARPG